MGKKKVIAIGFLVSCIVFLGHNLIRDTFSLFLFRGLAGIGAGMVPGPLAALAWGSSFGYFNAIGALGFTLGNFLGGVLKQDLLIFTFSALLCLFGLTVTFRIKDKPERLTVPLFPYKIIKKNLNVYVPFLIRHSAAQAIWSIFPLYLIELGTSKFNIGVIYALNPFMQFVFMLGMDRFKSSQLMEWGLIASAVTFLGYTISPTWQVILVLQVLLGFSWAALYLGSLKQLLENNYEQATASGFLNSVAGLAGIIGPITIGSITLFGIRALLLGSTLLAFSAFIISKILKPQAK